jgi:uncharacterized protein YbcI
MASTHTEHAIGSSKAAAISNHVVRMMSEYTGRGPTKARTHLNDDVVIVVLQDTLTKGERSLVGDDLAELVLTMRKAFQGTMRRDLVNGVEQILGRRVTAFMSDNHLDPDVAVEVFLLAAPDGSGPQDDGARGAAETPRDADLSRDVEV